MDSNNPFNSGNGFANALLGYFDTYQEATTWPKPGQTAGMETCRVGIWQLGTERHHYVPDRRSFDPGLLHPAQHRYLRIFRGGADEPGRQSKSILGERAFSREFNTAAFALPAVGTLGNMGPGALYRPGINNWDLAATKRFKLFFESRVLSFRGEFYNAFNHTQFSSWNTSFQFHGAGQQLNLALGQPNGGRPPRNVELSARFVF